MFEKMTASDALIKIFEEEGVEYIFGVPGSHILAFYDAIERSGKIKAILTKHEEGAAYMAKTYARRTGRPAVCTGTAGPGALNMVTGVADAYMDQVPMIVITGQVATQVFGKSANQEVTGEHMRPDQVGIFRSFTKLSTLVFTPGQVQRKAREAFRLALSEPFGPVHLSISSDIFGAEVEYEPLEPRRYRPVSWHAVDRDAVRKAAEMIMRAERPVVVAGHRATMPDSSEEIKTLADRFGIPVATTLVAKGIIAETDVLSLGCLDLFGHRLPDAYLESSDLIISVGEYFDEYSTVYYNPDIFAGKSLVQFDSYHSEIGKVFPTDLGVVGNIKAGLDALAEELSGMGCGIKSNRDEILALKEELNHFSEPEMFDDSVPLKPQRIMAELREAIPSDALLLCDVSSSLFWAARYFPVNGPGKFYCSWGIKPVGSGAGGAVGLQLAAPDKPVFCLAGDGGMQMNGLEVMTAVNHDVPVVWLVFNDGGLYLIRITQGLSYGERYIATKMKNPDFAKFAEACGADGYSVEKPGELGDVIAATIERRRPAVVDIKYDPDELLPIKPRAVLKVKEMGLNVSSSPFAAKALRKILDERRR